MHPIQQIQEAADFATVAHQGQVRKYTGEPYIVHPIEVAQILHDHCSYVPDGVQTCVALLHDVLEDCEVTYEQLAEAFGEEVAHGVVWLTDAPHSGMNRAARKEVDRSRLAIAPGRFQTVKYADIISNSRSILIHDPNFAVVYVSECLAALDVMADGCPVLREMARAQLLATKE